MEDITLPDGAAQEPRYSPQEIGEAISSLSAADFGRIKIMARHFAPRSGMTAEDLQQETFVRALGSRTCKVGTPVLAFLHGVMKSIASEAPRARKRAQAEDGNGLELVFVADYVSSGAGEAVAEEVSPESTSLSGLYHARMLEQALACIEDDLELQLLVEGRFDGLRGKELEDLLGTDTKGLAAARRRLAERLKARFPMGMSA